LVLELVKLAESCGRGRTPRSDEEADG